jgi:hypothetical protein
MRWRFFSKIHFNLAAQALAKPLTFAFFFIFWVYGAFVQLSLIEKKSGGLIYAE